MRSGRCGARTCGDRAGCPPLAVAALILLLGLACASQGAGKGKDALVVRDLELAGARRVPPRQIKKRILTGETGWWPFARKQIFDPVEWQSDLARIERLYEARGFYQAEVIKDEARPDGKGGVALRAEISEGEATRI